MPKQANPSSARQKSAAPVVAAERDSLPDEALVLLARQFACALVGELQNQLGHAPYAQNAYSVTALAPPTEAASSSSGKARLAKERAFELFKSFDQLPDDAYVPFEVVLLLEGRISKATGYRRIRAGVLPQPEYRGGTLRGFRVGTLRAARREAPALPAGLVARRAHQARASAAGVKAKQLTTGGLAPDARAPQGVADTRSAAAHARAPNAIAVDPGAVTPRRTR